MILRKWEELPPKMQTEEVRTYYDILKKKQCSLIIKRVFDIVVSFLMLVVLLPIFLILAISIMIDSKGPIFYRQDRITQYMRIYRIFKFRTMVQGADRGLQVTVHNDSRVTCIGKLIRRCRLDEICQLIDILRGTMTFVGTRPEVPKYVDQYTPDMVATLLLPAGVTSEASIFYKDESELLEAAANVDKTYMEVVLPGKMYYNLKAIEKFGLWYDIKVMLMTVFAMFGKEYVGDAPSKVSTLELEASHKKWLDLKMNMKENI